MSIAVSSLNIVILNTVFNHNTTAWTAITDNNDLKFFYSMKLKPRQMIINFRNEIYSWKLCYGTFLSYEDNGYNLSFMFPVNSFIFMLQVKVNNQNSITWRVIRITQNPNN